MKDLKLFIIVAFVIFAANNILVAQKIGNNPPKVKDVALTVPKTTNTNQSTTATVATVNKPNTEKTDSTVADNRGAGSTTSQSSAMTAEIVQNNSTESANAANVNNQPTLPTWQCKSASSNNETRVKVGIAIGTSSKANDDEIEMLKSELAKEFCGDSFELVRLTSTNSADYTKEAKRLNSEFIIVMDFESPNNSSRSIWGGLPDIFTNNAGVLIEKVGDIKGTPNILNRQTGIAVTTGGNASSQILNSFGNGQEIKITYQLLKVDINSPGFMGNVELLKEPFKDKEKVQGESAGEYAVRNLFRRTTENIHNKIMNPNYKLKKGK